MKLRPSVTTVKTSFLLPWVWARSLHTFLPNSIHCRARVAHPVPYRIPQYFLDPTPREKGLGASISSLPLEPGAPYVNQTPISFDKQKTDHITKGHNFRVMEVCQLLQNQQSHLSNPQLSTPQISLEKTG